MIKIKEKGEAFAVIPVVIEMNGIELKVFIAKSDTAGSNWLNALYYNDVMISNTDALYAIVSNMVSNNELVL